MLYKKHLPTNILLLSEEKHKPVNGASYMVDAIFNVCCSSKVRASTMWTCEACSVNANKSTPPDWVNFTHLAAPLVTEGYCFTCELIFKNRF